MPGSWTANEFLGLTDSSSQITSPATRRYNCIAWAAKDDRRWWWPDPFEIGYWPIPVNNRSVTLAGFVEAFISLGYKLSTSGELEPNTEKIAIYGIDCPGGQATPTHAARQLPSGDWTSKLGSFEDITHTTPEAVNGPIYGHVMAFMSRPRN